MEKGAGRNGCIDFIRGISVIAVLTNHIGGKITEIVGNRSFFSVTVFVFLSGITSYISLEKNHKSYGEYLKRKILKIFVPYAIATAIYMLYLNKRIILPDYLRELYTFTAAPPFYFFAFSFQLTLIAPLLFKIIEKSRGIRKAAICITGLVLSYMMMKYFIVFPEGAGGAIYLAGGSYFFVFLCGMCFGSLNSDHLMVHKKLYYWCGEGISLIGLYLLLTAGWLVTVIGNIDNKYLPAQIGRGGVNPSGFYWMLYSFACFGILYNFYLLVESSIPLILTVFKPIEVLGKYSLDIFMYHQLIFYILRSLFPQMSIIGSPMLYGIFTMSMGLVIPVLIKIIVGQLLSAYRRSWGENAKNI